MIKGFISLVQNFFTPPNPSNTIPFDVLCTILPHAFDNARDYRNLMLTCKQFLLFSQNHRDLFWTPYLQKWLDAFMRGLPNRHLYKMYRRRRAGVFQFFFSPKTKFSPRDFFSLSALTYNPDDSSVWISGLGDCATPTTHMRISKKRICVADYVNHSVMTDRKVLTMYPDGSNLVLDIVGLNGGHGTMSDRRNLCRKTGFFTNDVLLVGDGTIWYKNGVTVTGTFTNNLLVGNGTITWPDGSVFVGNFVDGKRVGAGQLTSDGVTIAQDWGTVDDDYDSNYINGQFKDNPMAYPKKHTYRDVKKRRLDSY